MFVDFNILNQLGSPSINSNTFANRPAAGQIGRLFVSTDTFEIFRDTGTTWDLIGGPGSSTITGTGTATQVAYFTGAQTIASSANLFWDNTAGSLGINTSTPSAELDIHGTGIIVQVNSTSATANSLLAFQRSGSGVWRIGDQYNGGSNFFELHNTVLTNNAIEVTAANNKSTFTSLETYASGLAIGNQFTYNLTVPNGVNITSPNAVHAVNSYLNLSLGGNTTVPAGARQGLEGNSRISFTGAGTLTMTQGSTVRAFSALSSVYSFNGSAIGTITHLAGLRICFPDNIGSAINITNNYGLLLNDQTAGLGTVTYTNRWGIYQEGASDLNYFNGNLLVKTTTNAGFAADINGTARIQGNTSFGGEISGPSNFYINGPTISTGTIWLRCAQVNFPGGNTTGSTFTYNGGNAIFSSGNVTVSLVGTGTPSFRISNTTSSAVWYFENHRNAPSGSLEITNSLSNPTITAFSSRNVAINSNTDAGFRLDVQGTLRTTGALTVNDIVLENSSGTRFFTVPATQSLNFRIGTTTVGFFSATRWSFTRGEVLTGWALFENNTTAVYNLSQNTTQNSTQEFINIFGATNNSNNNTGTTIRIFPGVNNSLEGNVVLAYTGTTKRGNVLIGTGTNAASAIVNVESTTQGFLPPRMTTAQKNAIAAPANGLVIYDTTLAKLCVFTGVNWETVTSV